MRGERILRNIDAIEVAIVGTAVLQMVDNLKRRAERVRCGPSGFALAMHIENEAPDRRRRIGAIIHQFGPIRVAMFDGIHPEGAQQIERMTRRELSPGESRAQRQRGFDGIALPGQCCLEKVEPGKLGVRRERRTVGDVVGAPGETVIGKNCGAMFWRDEHGGDGKIFA